MAVSRVFSVSSGARLSFLDVEEPAGLHGLKQRAVGEVLGGESSRSTRAGLWWPISLAGVKSALPSTKTSGMPHSAVIALRMVVLLVPGGPLEQEVPPGRHGRQDQVKLALPAHHACPDPVPDLSQRARRARAVAVLAQDLPTYFLR